MEITKERTAMKLLSYLKRQISLAELVDWAENAVMNRTFKTGEEKTLREVLGKLGVADVRTFGLSWEECDSIMRKLGYKLKIQATAA